MDNLDWERLGHQRVPIAAGLRAAATTLAELAHTAARETPDAIAFIDGLRTLSFAAIFDEAQSLAASLWKLGLRSGDVLSFQLPNWSETAVINLAACLGGYVCNPIVPIYRDAELTAILADCRSRAFFVPGVWRGIDYGAMAQRLAAKLPSLALVISVRSDGRYRYDELIAAGAKQRVELPQVSPDAVKLIMYTSGTTGPAKGVLHSHCSLPVAVISAVRQWGLRRGDALLMPSPVTHATGYTVGLELPFTLGLTTVLMERWNAEEAIDLIEQHHIAAAVGATPFLQELLEAMDAPSRTTGRGILPLKVFVCGGAAVPSELIVRAGKRFAGYACRGYGSTESPFITFGRKPGDSEAIGARTDGRLNCYDVRIVDSQDHEVVPGTEGEILVRGEGLFLGYSNPAATLEAFTGDGYFRTGDIGFRAVDDTLTITGRKKDLIIRGGENISAKEIEDVLHQHPLIAEAAVVSAPSARLGESIAAYLRTRDGAQLSAEELATHVLSAGLARQKCPEHVRVLDELPRTAAGKIRKDVLRGMIRAELAASAALRDGAPETAP
ncbi:AMP-binding protein [Nevskia ramosa]|uniref:AMP-binding protein n=1 Tax=Nevskia ramosa TaxID=64002 RepID=UPI0003B471B3|nr:AMP-binding protein [Nevskia ramosa]